jgi:sucrose phosphorylase
VERLAAGFRLMVDAVVNHISRQSEWFRRFEAGDPKFADWFITVEPDAPLDWVPKVVRPRALPLLTPVQRGDVDTLVWTTFSDDQVDLNFAHPDVLLEMIAILLFYVAEGAQIIRLDAIAYLWKTIGTSCIHLEETHRVVKLFRCVLDAVAPDVLLITETNVPHEENVSYYGQPSPEPAGTDEAQLVYQFPLAPLLLHSLLTGNGEVLSRWVEGLDPPSPKATFFNFTASHDGIGLMPARGLLDDAQIQGLVDATLAHGGLVSFKTELDGSRSVYELNISYFDALSDPNADEPLALRIKRFIVSQAIMLALRGLPGIYIHSLLGSLSWHKGVERTGRNRSINRQKFLREEIEAELADPATLRSQVYAAYRRLLQARSSEPAFHPYGLQRVLSLGAGLFTLVRTSPDRQSAVLCIHNLTAEECRLRFDPEMVGTRGGVWLDILSGESVLAGREGTSITLPPYGIRWLKT